MKPTLATRLLPVALMLGAASTFAQTYPSRPVRIVAGEIGGGNDFIARQMAPGLTAALGQQVIVDNRGPMAPDVVAKASPDGHTLLINGGQLWLLPFMREKVSYDPVRDFAPVTLVATSTGILVVHVSVPVTSVKELIDLAKAKPGQLNYASGALGAIPHISAELFMHLTGTRIVQIPYKGNGPALNDLIAGQVQLMFASASSIAQHLNSPRLRAIAVTSAKPSPLFPNLPTVAATVPGFETATVTAILAPRNTPDAIIRRLNQDIARVMKSPEVKDRFARVAVEAVTSTPEELAAKIKSEMTRLGKLIKDVGIKE
jgi:tripartite-type tricarboxylate transporter receptor subunit TctC